MTTRALVVLAHPRPSDGRLPAPSPARLRHCLILVAAAWLSVTGLGTAWAQSVGSGTIHGIVKDESGGTLPGVTATLTSPALQLPQVVAVTDQAGSYRFVDLPPGTYRLRLELSGFATSIRDELILTLGFVARVDETLKVGQLSEAITVSGQSPVVDVSSTSASVAFTKEVLDAVPRGRDLQNIFAMAPGVTQAVPDVGGSTMAQRQNTSSYGMASQPKLQVEGMNITMGADQNTPIYFNDNTLEEVQVRTSGNDAEVSVPGISMVAVMKSGGNTFHGTYAGAVESPKAQGNNLDDSLRAQNLSATSPLKSFYDVSADLGGRIVKDKLWFYGAMSRQTKTEGQLGFASGPGADGKYLTADDPLADTHTYLTQYSAKFSYQMSKNNRLIYAWQRGTKAMPENGSGRFVPLESTRDYVNPTAIQKFELQSTINPRTLVNVTGGYSGYVTDYNAGRSFARVDAPSRLDLETGLATGSHPLHQNKTRDRWQSEGSITFYPDRSFAGKHELKTGAMIYRDPSSDGYSNNVQGNYILITDKIGGVSGTPSRIQIYNTPVVPKDQEDTYAWYLKDSWRVTDSLTLNLGVRWERQHVYLAEQSREAARDFPTLFPAGTFPYKEIGTWNRTAPRAGVAWNLDGKSVVKATFGLYSYIFGDTFGDNYNTNATGTITFLWHDQNGNKLYDPGEVNLNPNGADFFAINTASSALLNTNLKQPKTWEGTASYERELAPNLGFRAMYVNRRVLDSLNTTNIARPYGAYDIPITRRDPGPDGLLNTADDAGKVTFYDYNRSYFGAAFVQNLQTNSVNSDRFDSVEFTVTKRSSGRWMGQVSYFVVKDRRWLVGTINTPNDNFFPVDEAWRWAGTVTGSYRMPGDVVVSGFLQSRSPILGQRTYIFRSADPDGGPPIAQSSTVTLRLEPYGSQKLSALNILNLRASKDVKLGGTRRVSIDFDVFNVMNANTPTSATFAAGPTFGYITNVIPARIARIGARFRF